MTSKAFVKKLPHACGYSIMLIYAALTLEFQSWKEKFFPITAKIKIVTHLDSLSNICSSYPTANMVNSLHRTMHSFNLLIIFMPYSQQTSFTFTNHINYNLMSMITLYVITHNKSANCTHANTRYSVVHS